MSGESVSCVPTDDQISARHRELHLKLDGRQGLMSLVPNFETDSELPKLLDMTRAELKGMTAEDVAISSALIQQAAYAVQRWENRCRAIAHWAEEAISHVIASRMGGMPDFAFKDRRAAAVKVNPTASRLNILKVDAETLCKDVEYLAARLEHSARVFENLARTKKQHG